MGLSTCKKCCQYFGYTVKDMHVLGGKDREYIICPYCKEINGSVVTSGFVYSYKIEEEANRGK